MGFFDRLSGKFDFFMECTHCRKAGRDLGFYVICPYCGDPFCYECGQSAARRLFNTHLTCPGSTCGMEYTNDPEQLKAIRKLGYKGHERFTLELCGMAQSGQVDAFISLYLKGRDIGLDIGKEIIYFEPKGVVRLDDSFFSNNKFLSDMEKETLVNRHFDDKCRRILRRHLAQIPNQERIADQLKRYSLQLLTAIVSSKKEDGKDDMALINELRDATKSKDYTVSFFAKECLYRMGIISVNFYQDY